MGVNVVEREGISFQHPARFILVGTMNPEEGELRPQLLDRFALSVDVRGLSNAEERMAILERHIAFDADPESFRREWLSQEHELSDRIEAARDIVDEVIYTRRDLFTIANLTASLHVDGHRADLVILKAARAHAAFEGRRQVTERDILLAAELALPHRLKRGPFSEATLYEGELEERVEHFSEEYSEESADVVPAPSAELPDQKKKLNR
jgi:Mg-chelatase subunit ChlI